MKTKIALLLLVLAVGRITSQATALNVSIAADVVDSDAGNLVPAGNQVWIGYFGQSDAWVQSHRDNLEELFANGLWQAFGTAFIEDVGLKPSNLFSQVIPPDTDSFIGKPIYVWAFETEGAAAPTQQNTLWYGLYSNATDPDWTFPGSASFYATAIDGADIGVTALWGAQTTAGNLLLWTPVPEPAHYALAIGLGLMLFSAGRSFFRRN